MTSLWPVWKCATKQAVMTVAQGPSKGPHNLTSTGPHLF
jgi:hypothetical protein